MKRIAAHVIQFAIALAGSWALGVWVRGPFADRSVPRDLAAGAALAGAMGLAGWSKRELGRDGG